MSPESVRSWLRIMAEFAAVAVAAFILVHETLSSGVPDATLIGAGLLLLGLPPAFRADEWWKRGTRDGGPEK